MVNIQDCMKKAREKSADANNRRIGKSYSKPITKNGVLRVFNLACQKRGLEPCILTKEIVNRISGFIRVFRSNDIVSASVYQFITRYVEDFDRFKGKKVVTAKGKEWKIGDTPNIKDLLYCRDALWNEITKTELECTDEVIDETPKEFDQAEFDKEFDRLMGA